MSNIILATPLSDNATISGTSALGSNDVFNMQRRDLHRVYRTSLTPTIHFDFGSATQIDFVSIIGHNGEGTVTIKAGTTSACEDYSSGALDLITGDDVGYAVNSFAHRFTAQTYRYWCLEIDDTGNADGYFQAGRVYVTKAFTPSINASYGLGEGFLDRSRVARTISGAVAPNRREPLRVATWTLSFGSEAEMFGTVRDIDLLRGISRDVLFIPDLDNSYFQKRYVYGIMDELPPIVSAAFNIYQKSFKITEIK